MRYESCLKLLNAARKKIDESSRGEPEAIIPKSQLSKLATDSSQEITNLYQESFERPYHCPRITKELIGNLYKNPLELQEKCKASGYKGHEFWDYRRANTLIFSKGLISILKQLANHGEFNDDCSAHRIYEYLMDGNELYKLNGTKFLSQDESGFPGYQKKYYIHTIECHKAATDLAYKFSLTQDSNPAKSAAWISIVVLRKSMELKFRRMLGFEGCFDAKSGRPVLTENSFFRTFVSKNRKYFTFSNLDCFDLTKHLSSDDYLHGLIKIYEWTNCIVHGNSNPYIWQIETAISFNKPLFSGDTKTDSSGTSSFNAYGSIKISNYPDLQKKLDEEIKSEERNENKNIDIRWTKPEAICLD